MRLLQRFSLMTLLATMTIQVSYSQSIAFTTDYRLYDHSLELLKSHIVIANGILKIDGVRQGLTGRLKPITNHNRNNRKYLLKRKSDLGYNGFDTFVTDTVELNFDKTGKPISMAYSYARIPRSDYNTKHVYMTTEANNNFITKYLIGKKFYRKSESCAELAGGGGVMNYGHEILEFQSHTILVNSWVDREYDYKKSEIQKPKQYTYYVQGTLIKVKELDKYSPLGIELHSMLVYAADYDMTNRRNWRFFEIVK
jgi:hypothetical protein